jgi:hypothetical protein
MASFYQIMGTLQQAISAALAGVVVDSVAINPAVALGWPSINVLQDVARGQNVPVTVYDRKIAKNTTRWLPEVIALAVVPATLTTAVSSAVINGLGTATITLGGTVTPGDAVSALLSRPSQGSAAQVAVGGSSDTPTTLAALLASQINADPTLGTWIHAVASGPVVTLTSLVPQAMMLQSYTGNGGTQTREVGRRERGVQIVCWCRTQDIRAAVVDIISGLIASDETAFGLTMPDGTVARLLYVSDYDLEDDTLEDVYRHDFMISLEYAVTTTDQLWAVLAPVVTFQIDTTLQTTN